MMKMMVNMMMDMRFEEMIGYDDEGGMRGSYFDRILVDKKYKMNKGCIVYDKNEEFVYKEVRNCVNFGIDELVFEECKDVFGLKKLEIEGRIKSDKRLIRKSKKGLWLGDMDLKVEKKGVIYLKMKNFKNIGSCVDNKELCKKENVRREMLKILLIRELFDIGDSNRRNMLVNEEGEVLSIDNNKICENSRSIFLRDLRWEEYNEEDFEVVLDDIYGNREEKESVIEDVFRKYEFDDKIRKVLDNFNGLRSKFNDEKNKKENKNKKNKKENKKEERIVEKVEVEVKEEEKVEVKNEMRILRFGGISYNGYKVGILKSGLNKYVRRNELIKGLYCLIELDLFKLMGDKSKGLRSNMMNRLMVVLNEDVGMELGVENYLKIYDLLIEWKKLKNCSDNEDRFYLVNIFRIMFMNRGNRKCSWMRKVYRDGIENDVIKEKYGYLYDGIEDVNENYGMDFYVNGDSENLKKYIDGFVKFLDDKNDKMYYYLFKILNCDEVCGKRNKKGKKMFVVLDILKRKCVKCDKSKKLYDFIEYLCLNNNNSRNEFWIYIVNFIRFFVNDFEDDDENEFFELWNLECINKFYERNLSGFKLELDDYLDDKHVCGKNLKKDKKLLNEKFVFEGSFVVDEKINNDVELVYKKIYEYISLNN